MSGATKSADAEWEAERRSGAQVIADQLRKYSNLKIQHPLRPSTFAAEGCVGDFTPTRRGYPGTASEAQTSREFGSGRWRPFLTVAFVVMNVAALIVLVASLGLLFGFLTWAVSVLGGCLFAEFWIVRPRAARRRAYGGDGV